MSETVAVRSRRGAPFFAALVAAVVAAGAAAWSGYAWWAGEHDSAVARGIAREDVIRAGQQGIATFTTLDYRRAADGYGRWLDASTGALHDELAKDRESGTQRIEQAKSVSTATILDSAVTELDETAGKATVIAAVEVSVTPDGAQPVVKHNRFQAELTRTDTGWKLTALGQFPVSGV